MWFMVRLHTEQRGQFCQARDEYTPADINNSDFLAMILRCGWISFRLFNTTMLPFRFYNVSFFIYILSNVNYVLIEFSFFKQIVDSFTQQIQVVIDR